MAHDFFIVRYMASLMDDKLYDMIFLGLLRCGKSCRLRWKNYLRPDIKRGKFSDEEEDSIIKLHEILGNK